jgi:hypothetical protein
MLATDSDARNRNGAEAGQFAKRACALAQAADPAVAEGMQSLLQNSEIAAKERTDHSAAKPQPKSELTTDCTDNTDEMNPCNPWLKILAELRELDR